MNTSAGSARWTDGAISFNDSLSDKLRIGIQLHASQFGDFGGPNLQVDWATGDYTISDKAKFAAGKVKTVYGLFNDSQDVDAVHLWVLLPESVYPTDNKSFLLSHYGGDFYGRINLGKRRGSLSYRGYAGYRALDMNGGYMKNITELSGLTFNTAPGGNVFGGDLRWDTPLKGLQVGVSAIVMNLDGKASAGSIHVPYATDPVIYARFERGRFMVAGEYKRQPAFLEFRLGPATIPSRFDAQCWYAMSSYRIHERLHVGGYYSHFLDRSRDTALPAYFSKDWAVSGRYDLNSYFYAKLEGHFIDGNGLGYYNSTNPAGLQPKTNMLAAKIGFSF